MAIQPTINIESIQNVVAHEIIQISQEMVKALMAGLQENLDFKGLAEKHISAEYKQKLSSSDAKIQMIFQKLFIASQEHIQKHSQPLVMTFAMMNQQTGNKESADMFLGTFVLESAKSVFEKLKNEQPEALENKEIWG